MTSLLLCIMAAAQPPIVLDNGAIRVELDAHRLAVRYVGTPGGRNFIEPGFAPRDKAQSPALECPGSLSIAWLPESRKSKPVTGGPAGILERSDRHVALLGPVDPAKGVRLKLEVQLAPSEGRASLRLTALKQAGEACRGAFAVDCALPAGTTLRVPGADATIGATNEPKPAREHVIIASPESTDVSIPGPFSRIEHRLHSGTWSRRFLQGGNTAEFKSRPPLCNVVVSGTVTGISAGRPEVYEEIWTIEPAGQAVENEE